jgi:hypothetical protein
MSGDVNSHIDGSAIWMNHGEPLLAIRSKLIAVLPQIGVKD